MCKVWISNHSVAIKNHENGSGHKEKMQQSAFFSSHAALRGAAPAPAACDSASWLRSVYHALPWHSSA